MALKTSKDLRSLNIYQVFLRQHTKEGTLLSLINDLPRIKSLGMNCVYLMPIHPIGKIRRKGLIGSPYSILDYKQIDEAIGTISDFKELVIEAQKLDLNIMMDMVFHHTSHDAVLYQEHPEWYLTENGLPVNKISDWHDIIDLDFNNEGLHEYLIDVLLYWLDLGVKGFRFDSVALIPLDFWIKARKKVKEEYPDTLFLGESSTLSFIKEKRSQGQQILSDSELYQAFDILYDYDVFDKYKNYLKDSSKLNEWLNVLINQESIYPENYVKLRALENHDTNRIASYVGDENKLVNLTALFGFLKGAMLIYAGQEYKAVKRPSLFEIDHIDLAKEAGLINSLIHRISHLRKDSLFQTGVFNIHLQDLEVALISYENEMSVAYGVFNLGNHREGITIDLKDGVYQNILYPEQVKIINGKLKLAERPMILFAMKRQL